jgi:hypothetical protein
MGKDDKDKPELHDREHVGITGGYGGTFVGIDAKHLDIDGHRERDEKTHHDHSWKTKAEEEPDEPDKPDPA